MKGVRGETWDISGVSTPLICWVSCRESKFTWISAHQSHERWLWVLEHMCWLKYIKTVGNSMVVVSPLMSFMIDQTVSQRAAETTFIIAWHTESSMDHPRQNIASINNTCMCMHTIWPGNDWAYQSCWHVGGHRAIMQTLIWPTWMKTQDVHTNAIHIQQNGCEFGRITLDRSTVGNHTLVPYVLQISANPTL